MAGSHLIIEISTCCVTTVKMNSRSFRNRLLFENRMKNVVMRAEFSAFSAAWNACFDIPYGNCCNFVGNELVTIIVFAQFFIVEYTIQHVKPIWNRIKIVVSRTLCRFFLGPLPWPMIGPDGFSRGWEISHCFLPKLPTLERSYDSKTHCKELKMSNHITQCV